MHQSIPAVPIPPPPGNPRAFAHVLSPGVGHSQFYRSPGAGRTPGRSPDIWYTCFRNMEKFIGKNEAFVKDLAVRDYKNLSRFLNICF